MLFITTARRQKILTPFTSVLYVNRLTQKVNTKFVLRVIFDSESRPPLA